MKPKLPKSFQFVTNRKKPLILAILLFSMIGLVTSCQSSLTKGTKDGDGGESPPTISGVSVYGRVDSLPQHLPGVNAVGIAWHKYSCSDRTSWSDTTGRGFYRVFKENSDTYDIPITASKYAIKTSHPCISIFVVHFYPPTVKNDKTIKGYSRILAGPKKLGGADFWSLFHLKPLLYDKGDSIQVDFVVHDSAKE